MQLSRDNSKNEPLQFGFDAIEAENLLDHAFGAASFLIPHLVDLVTGQVEVSFDQVIGYWCIAQTSFGLRQQSITTIDNLIKSIR